MKNDIAWICYLYEKCSYSFVQSINLINPPSKNYYLHMLLYPNVFYVQLLQNNSAELLIRWMIAKTIYTFALEFSRETQTNSISIMHASQLRIITYLLSVHDLVSISMKIKYIKIIVGPSENKHLPHNHCPTVLSVQMKRLQFSFNLDLFEWIIVYFPIKCYSRCKNNVMNFHCNFFIAK